MFLEVSVVILSVVFLLMVVLSVPFLLQIWRTAKSMATTLHMLNESLPGILKNLEDITSNINRATQVVNTRIEGLSHMVERVQNTVGVVLELEEVVRAHLGHPLVKMLINIAAVVKGIRVFLDVYRSPSREK
ncbi:MAG: DUF948 domain-containing protein [Deltaproteobacteria bacterium]|nr:DUF948 domain-containing protein [Deltaproteobacteria bacterium]